ncbi:MAG: site-specific integrase [Acidimicrobiia bacterium]|nr:site-specific integrase [Acidimicrobiia bacterium]
MAAVIVILLVPSWRSSPRHRPVDRGEPGAQALKKAAAAEGCDFPGLGPHSFRRANITWRQEVGGSSIEASKIAGHSTVRMTEGYTKIQLNRQAELTRLIQEKLASVGGQPAAAPVAVQELADVDMKSVLLQ